MKLEVLGSLVPCAWEGAPPAPPPPGAPPPPAVGPSPVRFEPGVFVEMAILEVPARAGAEVLSRNLQALALDPAVRLLGAPQLFVQRSRPTTGVFEEHFGPLSALALRDVAVAIRDTDGTALVVDFTLGLDLPTTRAVASAVPERLEVRVTTAPHAATLSAFAKPLPGDPRRMLEVVFTPYVMREEAEMRALFSCKMARRKRASGN